MKKIIGLLKSHFFTGFLILVPLGVIVWIGVWAFGIFWLIKELLPEQLNPEVLFQNPALGTLFNVLFALTVALLAAMGISALGWASKHYLGKKALQGIAHIIDQIPVLRSIYSALDQLLKTMAAQGSQQFSRVVYIEYPRKGTWVLAFVTGPATPVFAEAGVDYVNIYVPTTPNPTSGFHLVVSEKELKEAHMKVEEAFKVILSLGIAQPDKARHGR